MIYSMTGYGKAEGHSSNKEIIIEVKSLNGKQFEITNKINPLVKPFEADIRKILSKGLKRGSVDVNVIIKQDGAAKPMKINTALAESYYQSIKSIATSLNLTEEQILPTLMRLPEVVAPEAESIDTEDWSLIQSLLEQAIANLTAHRVTEGAPIEKDLLNRIKNIEQFVSEAEVYEPNRITRIKDRITALLEEWVGNENWDANRLEQELIYYIEKIDISEEKQRLRAHCDYFNSLIANANEEGIGKKLGFVLQEVGREINTLGSKANDATMQQIVVQMKDELEKAKEQVLNIV
ncbi:MAG: YicC family protein [Bacteroidetes bacterium 43-16]|nr:MAG: YicC family protein [Bacteroidetes bacterium 43-16]